MAPSTFRKFKVGPKQFFIILEYPLMVGKQNYSDDHLFS